MESGGMIDALHWTYPARDGNSLSDHRIDEPDNQAAENESVQIWKRRAEGRNSHRLSSSDSNEIRRRMSNVVRAIRIRRVLGASIREVVGLVRHLVHALRDVSRDGRLAGRRRRVRRGRRGRALAGRGGSGRVVSAERGGGGVFGVGRTLRVGVDVRGGVVVAGMLFSEFGGGDGPETEAEGKRIQRLKRARC
jgi:hypothetical protein